jgi:hypothetical protein
MNIALKEIKTKLSTSTVPYHLRRETGRDMRFGPIFWQVNSKTWTGRPPAWSDSVESEYWAGGGEAAGDLELRVHQLCLVLKLLPGMKPKYYKIFDLLSSDKVAKRVENNSCWTAGVMVLSVVNV